MLLNDPALAEVADRMGAVPQLWLFRAFLAIPFLVLAFLSRSKAAGLFSVCLAGGFSGFLGFRSVRVALGGGAESRALLAERGSEWAAHGIASSFLPLVLTAMVVVLRRPWRGMTPP